MCAAGITSTPLFDKTDKTKPMRAFVSTLNPLVGQPDERGASPLLYAAASPEIDGTPRLVAPLELLWLRTQPEIYHPRALTLCVSGIALINMRLVATSSVGLF